MTMNREKLVLPVCLFAVFVLWISGSAGTFVQNLTERCYQCLCYIPTGCNLTYGCKGGYCGPFKIARIYWADAGKIVLLNDAADRNHAWEDCARDYNCSKKIIEGYLQKYGRDCNGDGVTDCYDYMLVNGNGPYGCTEPIKESWIQRYKECQL